jgi:hypothetical protein
MELIPVAEVRSGDVIAFDQHEPVWVTALKVQADRNGYDLLYAPDGGQPRWRGFDEPDHVLRRA